MTGPVVVNGRFLTMHATGVQRYARELLMRLGDHIEGQALVAVPPGDFIDLGDRRRIAEVRISNRWHGPTGHMWEQAVLPFLVRRAGRRATLLSPATWGPVAVRRQVVVFLDIGPQLHPEFFPRSYRVMADLLTPLLVKRCARLGAMSGTVRDDLCRHYGVDPQKIAVIRPGVGAPFDRWPVDDLSARAGRYCLVVGAHDRRKNLAWIVEWWTDVYDELGLELVVTTKGSVPSRVGDVVKAKSGVSVRVDPGDDELAELYAGALCLLWPSLYEGFGLPLLEAMAVGTPFLSSDAGAARELAIEPEQQVLALDATIWKSAIRALFERETTELRSSCVSKAREWDWDDAAEEAAEALRLVASDERGR